MSTADAFLPDFDETPELRSGACPEGDHDFTVVESGFTTSKSGNPMVTMSLTVDNGENAGHKITEYFVFTEKNGRNFGAEKLKALCVAAGYSWQRQGLTMEQFAAQFVGLRASLRVQHSYRILLNNSWKDVKSRDEWDAHDGDKNLKSQVDFRRKPSPAAAPATLTFGAAPKAEAPKEVNLDALFS